ncbi:hypothetical protein [Candidimonas nitroreducens]|uniref:Uncharacterized protein n=1 Tax=Candidimonas nitroreducens TaxID=683354 RepID=A0A225M8F8_9BURK|nr:hypothetical protein [Candidimonas nitroreducens]OWT55239.1 hypothetical protein CEY11_21250 [Candidimonas nitroreducens]
MSDAIELPSLPKWMSGYRIPNDEFGVERDDDVYLDTRMQDYGRAAVELDRKRRRLKERAQLDAEWVKVRELQAAYRRGALTDLLRKANEFLVGLEDIGPFGEGWQSPQLETLIEQIRAVVNDAQEKNHE